MTETVLTRFEDESVDEFIERVYDIKKLICSVPVTEFAFRLTANVAIITIN